MQVWHVKEGQEEEDQEEDICYYICSLGELCMLELYLCSFEKKKADVQVYLQNLIALKIVNDILEV